MRFSEDFIRSLHDNNEIISVAQSYVELKRAGNTYVCRCPFHSEKTPSCHFWEGNNSFYCFGCGVGGDVITFIMKIENLEYVDAVKFLAQRAGMPLPENNDNGAANRRSRILEINREAGGFFHKTLFSNEGAAGLKYLLGRGLSENTIKKFGLGYAPNDYHKLHFHLKNLGYSEFEQVDASLLVNRDGKVYDKFRNRVMFPIFDTSGQVAAFGGRALVESDNTPKYLNSAKTDAFDKSSMLFALNIAKNSKADYFILCEGYMDVIAMHQAGFDSAVASLGTSFTAQQANKLSHLAKKEVVLAYDSDDAGQKAASKAITLLSEVGVNARVLKVEGAKDPDEYIKKFGAEAFKGLIERSTGAIEYRMDKLAAGIDLNSDDGKAEYIQKVVAALAEIKSEVVRDIHISRASKQTEIPADTIKRAVNARIGSDKRRAHSDEQRMILRPAPDRINPEANKLRREERAERGIICFLYHNPDKLGRITERLKKEFVTKFNKRVYEFLVNLLKNGRNPDISLFNEEFEPAEMGRITQIVSQTSFAHDEDVLWDYVEVLNKFDSGGEKDPAEMTDDELLASVLKKKENKR